MKTFVHIGFDWQKQPKTDELEPIFDKAHNWLRYAPNCWIVLTSQTAQVWYERLKEQLGPGDHVFICELNIDNRQGWLPKKAWKWIRENEPETP